MVGLEGDTGGKEGSDSESVLKVEPRGSTGRTGRRERGGLRTPEHVGA